MNVTILNLSLARYVQIEAAGYSASVRVPDGKSDDEALREHAADCRLKAQRLLAAATRAESAADVLAGMVPKHPSVITDSERTALHEVSHLASACVNPATHCPTPGMGDFLREIGQILATRVTGPAKALLCNTMNDVSVAPVIRAERLGIAARKLLLGAGR